MAVGAWLRSWGRSPAFTGQFSLTIVVGMGAASALISLMVALGYQPLPFKDPGQLVAVWERTESGQILAVSGPDLEDFGSATHGIFASLGAFTPPRVWLLDFKSPAEIHECTVEAATLVDLGIRPILGRAVRPDDEPLVGGGTPPAWISERLWRTRYGGSPSVLGTTIGIADDATGRDESHAQIVGVLPDGASIPLPFMENATDVWLILSRDILTRSRQADVFFGLARLRPGVTVTQAQAALATVSEQLGQRYGFDRGKIPVVQGLEEIAQGPARKTTGLLALGVALVFLLGCVNLAILMGAEGRRLRRAIAIRTVLGANYSRLWRDVAAEKCALTILSLGLGMAFAAWMLSLLARWVPAAGLGPALLHPPPLNLAVLLGFAAFAIAAALVWSALLVRVANAPGSSRTLAASTGLGYTGVSDSSPAGGRWRLILVATQAGIGICLLAAAALTARTYATLSTSNLGPAPRHTVLLSVSQRDNFAPTGAQVAEFNGQVLSRLERLPGTQTIALAEPFPPPGWPTAFAREGDAAGTQREASSPMPVSPGYFRALGIPILFGRDFEGADNSGSEPVAIISLETAEQNWATPRQALNSEIVLGSKTKGESNEQEEAKEDSEQKSTQGLEEKSKDDTARRYKIVGVVADFTGYWSQNPSPMIYLPLAQAAYALGGGVILRTSASSQAVAALAPQALTGMPIPATISDVSTMEARWQATLTRPLARMAGMLLLALLGLGLSTQGVYAVAAATVSSRQHELAVRAALGALPNKLVWTVTRQLLLAVIVGAALGVVAAVNLRPLLAHWLGAVPMWQPEPIIAALVLMALAAAAGCYFPARAATRANPVDILRQG